MCYFITAILPKEYDRERAKGSIKKWKMDFSAVENDFIQRQLRAGEQYAIVTGNYCDCGNALTIGPPNEYESKLTEGRIARKVAKLKKKGWGQAKIDKWLEQIYQADEKRAEKAELTSYRSEFDLQRWLDFITDFVESNSLDYMGLLFHFYSGSVYVDRFTIESQEEIELAKLTTDYLYLTKADVVYRFVKR